MVGGAPGPLLALLLLGSLLIPVSSRPARADTWARTYGPGWFGSVQATGDGGLVLAGGADPCPGCPADARVLKLDASGQVEWDRRYGGDEGDYARKVRPLADGGYVVGGATASFGAGDDDLWVLRLDAAGDVVWQFAYGGDRRDEFQDLQPSAAGGVIVVGNTWTQWEGEWGAWVLKLSETGAIEWERIYGVGPQRGAEAYAVEALPDGGYAVAGGDWFGNLAYWLLRLDATGGILWEKGYSGPGDGYAFDMAHTTDGGFVLTGYRNIPHPQGMFDFGLHILKTDARGDLLWLKTEDPDRSLPMGLVAEAAPDGGAIVGCMGAWVVRLDPSGTVEWLRDYAGVWGDNLLGIEALSDGSLAMAGNTASFADGEAEAWLLSADPAGKIPGCCFVRLPQRFLRDDPYTQSDFEGNSLDTRAVVTPTAAVPVDLVHPVRQLCQEPGCPLLECGRITAPGETCDNVWMPVELFYSCGQEPVAVEWDFDDDGLTDLIGNPVSYILPAGDRVPVWATAVDACDDPGPQACGAHTYVRVYPAPEPVIDPSGPTEFCAAIGGSVLLDARSWFQGYRWARDGVEIPGAFSHYYWATSSGTCTVTVRDSHDCTATSPPVVLNAEACGPGEVSDVAAGEPPLRIGMRGDEVTVAAEPGATAYNIYAGDLDDRFGHTPAERCHIDTWRDNGDGTLTMDRRWLSNQWILVTASNADGEGPMGRSSDSLERMSLGPWRLCGPHR